VCEFGGVDILSTPSHGHVLPTGMVFWVADSQTFTAHDGAYHLKVLGRAQSRGRAPSFASPCDPSWLIPAQRI